MVPHHLRAMINLVICKVILINLTSMLRAGKSTNCPEDHLVGMITSDANLVTYC